MKRNVISLIVWGLLCFGSVLYAGEMHNHDANVIKVDKKGKTALCACGKEFMVTDSTPKVMADGMTYYLCSDGCKAKFSENLETIKPKLDVKLEQAKAKAGMLGNVYKVSDSGEMTAKCACGMDVTVTENTVSRMHDGETYYFCSDHCASNFDQYPDKVSKTAREKAKAEKSKTM